MQGIIDIHDCELTHMHTIDAGNGGRGAREEEDLADENRYNKELLALLKQEGGGNSLFETYCSAFEDHYGDYYDWQGDTATQHYLCRLLFTYYNLQVRSWLISLTADV